MPFVLLAGVLLAGAAGASLGARLADAATRPGHTDLVIPAPALAAGPSADALRAPGGFTGFGGAPALSGYVFRTGTVTAVDAAQHSVTVESSGSVATVHYAATTRFFRLAPLTAPLSPGDVIVVRYDGNQPVGVMRVPSDLEQGIGASQSPRERGLPPITPP